MTSIVRFAPSPTGRIHIGNARTAILNWLYACKTGGQFILRYDDTDTVRSTEEYARGIAVDLDWLGIKPQREEHQSKRTARLPASSSSSIAAIAGFLCNRAKFVSPGGPATSTGAPCPGYSP